MESTASRKYIVLEIVGNGFNMLDGETEVWMASM